MDGPDDEGVAVLFALEGAEMRQSWPITPSRIFLSLPKTLREKWHVPYLVREVLPKLSNAGLVEASQVEPGILHYSLTPNGKLKIK